MNSGGPKRRYMVSSLLSDIELEKFRRIPAASDAERVRILVNNASLTSEIARAVGQELRPEIRLALAGMKESVERERFATRELIVQLTRQIEMILKGGNSAFDCDEGKRSIRPGLL